MANSECYEGVLTKLIVSVLQGRKRDTSASTKRLSRTMDLNFSEDQRKVTVFSKTVDDAGILPAYV